MKINEYEETKDIDWNELTQIRYVDWAITTPLMLLVLTLVLSFNSKTIIKLKWFTAIIFFNYIMLYTGYLGETGDLERMIADIMGFIAFFITFGIIFVQYVLPRFNLDNYLLFGIYLLVWGAYGIAYNLTEINKNIFMNYLDLTSKCLIGIGLWIYYTKIIRGI